MLPTNVAVYLRLQWTWPSRITVRFSIGHGTWVATADWYQLGELKIDPRDSDLPNGFEWKYASLLLEGELAKSMEKFNG